jgi:acetyl esterase/lipase
MTLYRGMDKAALDVAYNNSLAIGFARRDAYFADWKQRSDAVRATHRRAELDIRYGAAPRQLLDWYPAGPGAPTLLYIHGGYWQGGDKADYAFIARGPNEREISVAVVEYTLGPEKRMDAIVAEIREAVAWLLGNLGQLGGDPRRLYVSGHSAGGHLTAMAMAEPRLAGGLAISGIFDLEPIRLGTLNDKLHLNPAEAQRNSPMLHLPPSAGKLIVTVGGDERPELQRQSEEYYAAWTASGLAGQWVALPGHDHFSVLDELSSADGRLCAAVAAMATGPRSG